jgi:membrane associated rhomboid family serine protease
MSDFRYTRPNNLPPILKNLIIINVLVFIAQLTLDPIMGLTNKLALWPIGTEEFRPYQIATHMFTHGFFFHIFFNMFALWMFGKELENYWGPKRFLFFYLVCGVGAAAAHLGVEYLTGSGAPAVGASGAVMGVLVAYAYLFPNTQLIIFPIPIPVKAKWVVMGYVAIDLFSGVTGRATGVAHFAHLGGALTGFILVLIWNKTGRKRFY